MADALLLADGSGRLTLADGSGVLLLATPPPTPPIQTWVGLGSGSTSAADPAFPAGIPDGNDAFCAVINKATGGTGMPPEVATPSGWEVMATGADGSGTAALDTGPVRTTLFRRLALTTTADSSVVNTDLIVNPAGSSFVYSVLFGLARAQGLGGWEASIATAADVDGDSFVDIFTGDPGVQYADWVLGFFGLSKGTGTSMDSQQVFQDNVSYGGVVEMFDGSTSSGFAGRMVLVDLPVVAGASTGLNQVNILGTAAAIVASATGSVIRLREVTPPPPPSGGFSGWGIPL
jgi:hypothetical protein